MESGLLPNSAITASSVYGTSTHGAWLGRLNNVPKGNSGAWSAASNKAGQWLQIDLGEQRLLTNFATQGRPSSLQWVTSYTILFSSDSVKWEEYKENGVVKVCDAFFSRGISHATRHVTLPVSYDLSWTARGYLFVRFIAAMYLSFFVFPNYYLE